MFLNIHETQFLESFSLVLIHGTFIHYQLTKTWGYHIHPQA